MIPDRCEELWGYLQRALDDEVFLSDGRRNVALMALAALHALGTPADELLMAKLRATWVVDGVRQFVLDAMHGPDGLGFCALERSRSIQAQIWPRGDTPRAVRTGSHEVELAQAQRRASANATNETGTPDSITVPPERPLILWRFLAQLAAQRKAFPTYAAIRRACRFSNDNQVRDAKKWLEENGVYKRDPPPSNTRSWMLSKSPPRENR